jgi:hypothetical protein
MVEKNFFTPESISIYAYMGVFSKEEVDILRRLRSQLETFVGVFSRLMSRLKTFVVASSFFAHIGNLATTLNASSPPSDDGSLTQRPPIIRPVYPPCFLLIIFVPARKMLE